MKKIAALLIMSAALSGCAGHTWLACDADFYTLEKGSWKFDFKKENSVIVFPTANDFSYTIDGVQRSSPTLSPKGNILQGQDYQNIYSISGKTYSVRDKERGQGVIINNCRKYASL